MLSRESVNLIRSVLSFSSVILKCFWSEVLRDVIIV